MVLMVDEKPILGKDKLYWVKDVHLPIARYPGIENKSERPILCVAEKRLYVICYRLTTQHNGGKLHNKIRIPAHFKVGSKLNYIIVNEPLILLRHIAYSKSESVSFENMVMFFDQLRKTWKHWNRYLKAENDMKSALRFWDEAIALFKQLNLPIEEIGKFMVEVIIEGEEVIDPRSPHYKDFQEFSKTFPNIKRLQNIREKAKLEKNNKK